MERKTKAEQHFDEITLACLALISVEMHNNTLKKSREEKKKSVFMVVICKA